MSRRYTKQVPPPPAVLDLNKVKQAVQRRIDLAKVEQAVNTRPPLVKPQKPPHRDLPAEDAIRRKVVSRLNKRQCSGFHNHDFHP